LIGNPYPRPEHQNKLITSTESPIAHPYYDWSMSVTAIVS